MSQTISSPYLKSVSNHLTAAGIDHTVEEQDVFSGVDHEIAITDTAYIVQVGSLQDYAILLEANGTTMTFYDHMESVADIIRHVQRFPKTSKVNLENA